MCYESAAFEPFFLKKSSRTDLEIMELGGWIRVRRFFLIYSVIAVLSAMLIKIKKFDDELGILCCVVRILKYLKEYTLFYYSILKTKSRPMIQTLWNFSIVHLSGLFSSAKRDR